MRNSVGLRHEVSVAIAGLLLASCAATPTIAGDAGSNSDAGVASDAGADGGTELDAGPLFDAGATPDAGPGLDAGAAPDAGESDAGCSGYVTVTAGNERSERFSSICDGSWGSEQGATTAVAYLLQGGAPPGYHNLIIDGCSSAAMQSAGIELTLYQDNGVGSYTNGAVSFTDDSGEIWGTNGSPFNASITLYGNPGEAVEGTFTATVTGPSYEGEMLAGSFHGCRVPDEDTP